MKRIIYLLLFMLSGSLLAESQVDTLWMEAESGDGIIKMLKRYGYDAEEYFDVFLEQNSNLLPENQSLKLGVKYMMLIDSLDFEDVVEIDDFIIEDSLLLGAVIYVISGHGGPDPGAVATINGHKVSEDEYAYDIALRLKYEIEKHAGIAYMIITDPNDSIREEEYLVLDTDELCYPSQDIPYNQINRLKQRSDAVNDLYAEQVSGQYQRVLVLHIDSRSEGQDIDVFFYHYPGSKNGKTFATNIKDVFGEKYAEHQPNRGYEGTVSDRNLMVLRKTLPPAAFVELGNIRNTKNQKRFLQPANRQALAKWLCEGLIRDFETKE